MKKKVYLLVNLGSPSAPTESAIRSFLKQFLSDKRVIHHQSLLWSIILNFFILKKRPAKLVPKYQKILINNGMSPLLHHMKQLFEKIKSLAKNDKIIYYAMRYGEPDLANALQQINNDGVTDLVILPLYPQYSASTTESVFDVVQQYSSKFRTIKYIHDYHDNDNYISLIVDSINLHQREFGKPDCLVLSYHGLPESYVTKGDPYIEQCYATTKLIVEKMNLNQDEYVLCFQSRFGRTKWVKPYAQDILVELAQEGKKNIQLIAPGFSCDCLETLEEIAIQNKKIFLDAGGESYHYIPCINASDDAVKLYLNLFYCFDLDG